MNWLGALTDAAVCLLCERVGLHTHEVTMMEETGMISSARTPPNADDYDYLRKDVFELPGLREDDLVQYWRTFSEGHTPYTTHWIEPTDETMRQFLDWLTGGDWTTSGKAWAAEERLHREGLTTLFRKTVLP